MNTNQCTIPPKGWRCTRDAGHEGPCAAVKIPWWKQAAASFGNAVGEALFGGRR